MINITIPNNNIKERKYILDIFFDEFFGLDYNLEIGSKDYEINLKNDKKLIVKDRFFNKYPKDLEYLKLKNIPKKIEELDIFSASFFMLTRWEEYVNRNRDSHNRFPATESLAFRQGFLDRPIVNEYVEALKQMLLELDNNLSFKERKFELVLTHDVDEVKMWKSWKHVSRVVLGDILKRKNLSLALERFAEYFLIRKDKINDPFYTFDWLMDKSEAICVKSRFYFMSGGVTEFDNRYKIGVQKELIEKIQKRGHIVGIHPSYNAYNDFEQFKKEKELLENVAEQKIVEGREHYLRFEVPTTWQIWEDNGMEVDCTCGYADKEGFRCGTGDTFSVFNILTREKLKLKEHPLIFMDGRDFKCGGYSTHTQFQHNLLAYLDVGKKYQMTLVLLFHNTSFHNDKRYIDEYTHVLDKSYLKV